MGATSWEKVGAVVEKKNARSPAMPIYTIVTHGGRIAQVDRFVMLQAERRDYMNATAKIQHKGQVTIPTSVRRLAGLSKGDLVNFAFQRGKIIITPRVVVDRSQFPNADDEYTPAQRKAIDRGIAQSEKEYKQGEGLGPFDSHAEFIASLHKGTKKPTDKKNKPAA